jgi:hypothetical protein
MVVDRSPVLSLWVPHLSLEELQKCLVLVSTVAFSAVPIPAQSRYLSELSRSVLPLRD